MELESYGFLGFLEVEFEVGFWGEVIDLLIYFGRTCKGGREIEEWGEKSGVRMWF